MCKWCKNEFCTNDKCPYCADYCPVTQDDRICKYRESNVTTPSDEQYEDTIRRLIGGFPKGSQKEVWAYINSLKERIEDAEAIKLYALKMQNGVIDMTLGSEHCRAFLASIVQVFEQNGAKNFFTTTVEVDNRKGDRYALTIQKTDGKTPAEELSALKEENHRLTENSKAIFKELRMLCNNDFHDYGLTEDDVNKYEQRYGVQAENADSVTNTTDIEQGSHASWLISCPASDGNFKSHLKSASVTDLRSALTTIKGLNGNKTKIKIIEAEIIRREKEK